MLKTIDRYRDSVFFICLTAGIVTLPFSIRINSIAIIFLVASWLFKNTFKEKFRNLCRPLFLLSGSLYLIHIIGMFWTSNISHGIFELEKKLSLLIFPVVLASINPLSKEELKKIVLYFAFACVAASLVCLSYATYRTCIAGSMFEVNPESNYITHYFFYFGLSEIFIHPVYFSAYIVFSICALFKVFIDSRKMGKQQWNVWIIAAILYLIVFLCLLSSRIMIIGFLLIVLIYGVYSVFNNGITNFKICLTLAALVGISLAVLFVPAIYNRFSEIATSTYHFENNPQTNKNLSGKVDGIQMKLAQWHFTIEAGKDKWLCGVGTGDDEDELMKAYKDSNFMEGYVPRYNSHNQYFQTWLGLGVVGLVVLLLSFIIPLFNAFKQKQYSYILFLFIVMFFCLTESVLCRQQGVVFYSFFNSLFLFHLLRTKKN